MTVARLDEKYSRVTPDDGKMLAMGDDERKYSAITCKHKMVSKIKEVDADNNTNSI